MRYAWILGAALALAAGQAVANNCPVQMKVIDDALANPARAMPASDLNQVKRLRQLGEKQHAEGKHKESMETLGKAKAMLGLK